MTEPRRAFVLAAGLGTRLRPLSEELPKPAWPFFDVPLAAHVLSRLAAAGVGEVIVNLHHLGDRLREALHAWVPDGLEIRWSPEETILGTGGALVPWRNLLGRGPFLLCNADTYQEIDLLDLWRFHGERGGAATLAVRRVSDGERAPIEIDEGGRVVRFLSARAPGAGLGLACEFTGIHVLEPPILEALPPGVSCINADVHSRLVARGVPLYGYDPGGDAFWSDLGTPERYLAAHRHFLRAGRLPAGSPGRLVADDGETEDGGRVLAPSYLGPGARVKTGGVAGPFAVLGAGSVLGDGGRVESGVVWGGSRVGGAELRGAILSPAGQRLETSRPA